MALGHIYDSDQPGHSTSLTTENIHVAKDLSILHADSKVSDQRGGYIHVYAGILLGPDKREK